MSPQVLKNVNVEITRPETTQHVISFAERFGLDAWDWAAIIIALISLAIAIWAAILQFKTEKNTMKITVEGQFDLLVDYFRHFYANLIIVVSVYKKLNKQYETHYPSEEHFRKLTVELEVLHPEAFFHSKEKYNSIHNLYLLIRNFNEECGVAEEHICHKDIFTPAKDRDMNTLIFKQDYFVGRFSDCLQALCGIKQTDVETYRDDAKEQFIKDQTISIKWVLKLKRFFRKRRNAKREGVYSWYKYISNAHENVLARAFERNNKPFEVEKGKEPLTFEQKVAKLNEIIKEKKIPDYLEGININNFIKILFPDDKELFVNLLNYNIYCEMEGKNSQGYDKIFILPFE